MPLTECKTRAETTVPASRDGPAGPSNVRAVYRAIAAIAVVAMLGLVACDAAVPRDVPLVKTPHPVVERMLEIAGVDGDDLVYDLGSGDGRIVIAAARGFGARAVGVEIDPDLVAVSRRRARDLGVADRVTIRRQDLFETDLHDADVVTLYLLPTVNRRLLPRLIRQLRPGSRVVSYRWNLGPWPPDQHEEIAHADGVAEVFGWVVPVAFGGIWNLRRTAGKGEEAAELRLRQRFQTLLGDLEVGGRRLTLEGTVAGDSARLRIVRTDGSGPPGAILSAWLTDGAVVIEGPDGEAWRGGRRPSRVAGVWEWADPGGESWRLHVPDGPGPPSVTRPGGEGPPGDTELWIWGGSLHLLVDVEGGAGEIFDGLVQGDRLVGSWRTSSLTERPWRARRVVAEPVSARAPGGSGLRGSSPVESIRPRTAPEEQGTDP